MQTQAFLATVSRRVIVGYMIASADHLPTRDHAHLASLHAAEIPGALQSETLAVIMVLFTIVADGNIRVSWSEGCLSSCRARALPGFFTR